jgi:hypothetical protein
MFAAVVGAIIAQETVIRGKMTGLIRATRVLFQASARVESEIIYQSLSGGRCSASARRSALPSSVDEVNVVSSASTCTGNRQFLGWA